MVSIYQHCSCTQRVQSLSNLLPGFGLEPVRSCEQSMPSRHVTRNVSALKSRAEAMLSSNTAPSCPSAPSCTICSTPRLPPLPPPSSGPPSTSSTLPPARERLQVARLEIRCPRPTSQLWLRGARTGSGLLSSRISPNLTELVNRLLHRLIAPAASPKLLVPRRGRYPRRMTQGKTACVFSC